MAELSQAISQLDSSAAEYLLLEDNTPEHGHCIFRGPFQGHNLIWDCHIHALCTPTPASPPPRQYIDIPQQQNTNLQPIHIGLNVINITPSTILKTIIMVRQYKNLNYGRHEWK